VATRNRAAELCRTLDRLACLPERPQVIVVDNASRDGTCAAVRERHPAVESIRLTANRPTWARNVGTVRATTPYVAFSDDDSWWAPGALQHARAVLDAHPSLGLVAARTLVGPDNAEDPINGRMAASPLPRGGLPGPRILGFLACAVVVRRAAFLEVGGYSKMLGIGGEERLLAADLAAAGWAAVYLEEMVAYHHPSPIRQTVRRRCLLARNEALFAWLRRPARRALVTTGSLARRAWRDPVAARAIVALLLALPRALMQRRALPPQIEAQLRVLEAGDG